MTQTTHKVDFRAYIHIKTDDDKNYYNREGWICLIVLERVFDNLPKKT